MSPSDPLAYWKDSLQGWAIPDEIVESAPESPWGFPPGLFARRASSALERPLTFSNRKALDALPDRGSVLDVGSGGGAASLPLAHKAGSIVAVDTSEEMLDSFRQAASRIDMPAQAVCGSWPEIAPEAPATDVVVCNHVLYNVQDLGPFAAALDDHARRRVVIELTPQHPLAWMNDLWLRFHGLRRPQGPTFEDAARAIRSLGPDVRTHEEVGVSVMGGFETRQDALAFVRKRMCLQPEQDEELAGALGNRLRETDGGWSAAPHEHRMATLWWDV